MKVRTVRAAVLVVAVVLGATTLASCQKVTGGRYVQRVFTAWQQVATAETYRTALDFDLNANIELKLDIYVPQGDTVAQRPVQMWMHGGAWTKGVGDRTMMTGYAQDAALRGYVGVTIDYRLRTTATLPGAALDAYDDAVAAVAWLKANAGRFGIDPSAIIAAGYSAGSINAMNLVYTPYERLTSPPAASPVLGGFGIAGANMGLPAANRPPVIMFSAVDDSVVPHSSVTSRCSADQAAGNICQLVEYPSGDHYIAFSQTDDIESKSAQFAMTNLLPKAGYYIG